MGFLGVVLTMLVGGYFLGIWTATNVFREPQRAYEDGSPELLAMPSLEPMPMVAGTPEPTP
jgi:hypothetical protein